MPNTRNTVTDGGIYAEIRRRVASGEVIDPTKAISGTEAELRKVCDSITGSQRLLPRSPPHSK